MVSGWKKERYDQFLKQFLQSYLIERLKASRIYLHDFNYGLKAYNKNVIKNIEVYGEMHRYIPMIASGLDFQI